MKPLAAVKLGMIILLMGNPKVQCGAFFEGRKKSYIADQWLEIEGKFPKGAL